MTCGACLSCYSGAWTLLQWSVDSAALIGYHVGQCACRAVPALLQWSVDSAALIGYHVGQ